MKRYAAVLAGCLVCLHAILYPQGLQKTARTVDSSIILFASRAASDSAALAALVRQVESGILNGQFENISRQLSPQVYINLRGNEAGYYSANQASYILLNFFGARTTLGFKLSTIGYSEGIPYATGAGTFTRPGKREMLQVYVGLTKIGLRWVISQFNVY